MNTATARPSNEAKGKRMATQATIEERGNGFPSVGDYVPGDDGLYRVVSIDSRIETGRAPGCSSWIRATVEEADWEDCDEGEEFPASVLVGDNR